MSQLDALIVGGGLAGLCAARRLQELGLSFKLIEAANQLGGRVRTDEVDGFLLDRGFQVLLKAYPAAREMLDYDALNLRSFYAGAYIRRNQKWIHFPDPFRNPKRAFAALTAPIGNMVDRWRLLRLRGEIKGEPVDTLSRREAVGSTLSYLEDRGFSRDMIDTFFRPFFGGVFLETDLVTSDAFFRFTFRMFSEDDASVPGRGMGQIPEQLAAGLPESSIYCGARAVAVESNRVKLENGETLSADAVILATDGRASADLLDMPPPLHQAVQTFYFAAPQAPVDHTALMLFPQCQWLNTVHVVSNVAPETAPEGQSLISVTVVRDHHGEDASLEVAVLSELRDEFGDQVGSWRLLRDYLIRYALPCSDIPIRKKFREVSASRGIVLCGDYLGQPSIQEAMEKGREAADIVAKRV